MKKLIFLLAVLIPIGLSAQVIRPLSYTAIQKLTVDTLWSTHVQATTGTIGTLSLTTLSAGAWNGTVIAGQYGGTGVANTGKTITLGGNFVTSGAYAATLTLSNTTNVTLPTTGTLATLGGTETFTGPKTMSGANIFYGKIATITDTANLAVADYVILADATSSAILMQLPAASSCSGKIIKVKCINADAEVKITTAGGTIDGTAGATGITLAIWDGREFMSNGTNWYIISKF